MTEKNRTLLQASGCVFLGWYYVLLKYSHCCNAMLPEIEYYSAGDRMATDYKSEIWISIKNSVITKNQYSEEFRLL